METKAEIITDVAKRAFAEITRRLDEAGLDEKGLVVHINAGGITVIRFPKTQGRTGEQVNSRAVEN